MVLFVQNLTGNGVRSVLQMVIQLTAPTPLHATRLTACMLADDVDKVHVTWHIGTVRQVCPLLKALVQVPQA